MRRGRDFLEEKNRAGHSLRIEGKTRVIATEVIDVGTVGEEGVTASTKVGGLHVRGRGLKVIRLDAATGELELMGEVQAVSYMGEQRPRSFLAKLFR